MQSLKPLKPNTVINPDETAECTDSMNDDNPKRAAEVWCHSGLQQVSVKTGSKHKMTELVLEFSPRRRAETTAP